MKKHIQHFCKLNDLFNEEDEAKECRSAFGRDLWSELASGGEERDTAPDETDGFKLLKQFIDGNVQVNKGSRQGKAEMVDRIHKSFLKMKECEKHFRNRWDVAPVSKVLYRGLSTNIETLENLKWSKYDAEMYDERRDIRVGKGSLVSAPYVYKGRSPLQSWSARSEIALRFSDQVKGLSAMQHFEKVLRENKITTRTTQLDDDMKKGLGSGIGYPVKLTYNNPGAILVWNDPDHDQLFLNEKITNAVADIVSLGHEYEVIRISNEPINVELVMMEEYLQKLIDAKEIIEKVGLEKWMTT